MTDQQAKIVKCTKGIRGESFGFLKLVLSMSNICSKVQLRSAFRQESFSINKKGANYQLPTASAQCYYGAYVYELVKTCTSYNDIFIINTGMHIFNKTLERVLKQFYSQKRFICFLRCILTTVNPATGEKEGDEPLATLRR